MKKRIFLLPILLLCVLCIRAQVKFNQAYQDYVNQYKGIAMEQMVRHRIPASITLAQALLESGAGKSDLASRSNNHFGIKCGSSWSGPYVTHDDDRQKEKFRKYSRVSESYEDHSLFLKRDRYSRLFQLDIYDYKGWAHGLKACGYATNPAYASRLISIIDAYDLSQYDYMAMSGKGWNSSSNRRLTASSAGGSSARERMQRGSTGSASSPQRTHHIMTYNNGVRCVKAADSDDWNAIAMEYEIPVKKLLKYNDATMSILLKKGDYVYLEKKKSHADTAYRKDYWHHVMNNESMYDIAQHYAMRLKSLYKKNFKSMDYKPRLGDMLKVR